MINLGDRAKDIITGFEGIAVAKTSWLYGCDRVTLQPETIGNDGKIPENCTFDVMQLKLVKAGVVKIEAPKKAEKSEAKTGGPQNDRAALRRN
jgi:hypothetical protein